MASRSAKEVIDQAIRENRAVGWRLYAIAAFFALLGLLLLVWGLATGQGIVTMAGAISGALCTPAIRWAHQIRTENISIRLLEDPLGRAETESEAATMLYRLADPLLDDPRSH